MKQLLATLLLSAIPALAHSQVAFPTLSQPIATYSFEDRNWGTATLSTPKRSPYHAPTPTSIPGARVIKTLELKALLESRKDIIVIDVLDSKERRSIPGAHWMSGAGSGEFYAAEKSRFAAALDQLSGGDKSRPVVTLCISSECWLSYNAALHAIEAGYKDVIWYRGGTNAWTGASLDLSTAQRRSW